MSYLQTPYMTDGTWRFGRSRVDELDRSNLLQQLQRYIGSIFNRPMSYQALPL
jgi:hypothetical protein